jgi:hypothetical protein
VIQYLPQFSVPGHERFPRPCRSGGHVSGDHRLSRSSPASLAATLSFTFYFLLKTGNAHR